MPSSHCPEFYPCQIPPAARSFVCTCAVRFHKKRVSKPPIVCMYIDICDHVPFVRVCVCVCVVCVRARVRACARARVYLCVCVQERVRAEADCLSEEALGSIHFP